MNIQLTTNIDGIYINKIKQVDNMEGFGSIFQMILNLISYIYLVNKKFNIQIKYYHTPVKNIGHKPSTLSQEEWDKKMNDYMLTLIPKDIISYNDITNCIDTNYNNIQLINNTRINIIDYNNKSILDSNINDIYKYLQNNYKYRDIDKNVINISLHIRNFNNNDICLGEEREYFNKCSYVKEYYINLIKTIKKYCNEILPLAGSGQILPDGKGQNKSLIFHIHSQGSKEQFSDIMSLNENIILHLDKDLCTTLDDLINSDILVLSKSSLSAIVNYYSRGINIVLDNFWHKLTENTIYSNKTGEFSYEQFKFLFNKLNITASLEGSNITTARKDSNISVSTLNNTNMDWLEQLNVKLDIPNNIKHIKISIGESYNAPYSYLWLRELPNRLVFGFEPHPESIKSILSGEHEHDKQFPNRLRMIKKYIDEKKYILIPCALDIIENEGKLEERTFYLTKNDVGCSSLLKPRHEHWFEKEIKVKCIDLYSFLKLIPDRFEYIEHVKIDAQGADFRIIKSAKDLIKKIVYLTLECGNESTEYHCNTKDSGHKKEDIVQYMKTMNFELIDSSLLYMNDKTKKNIVYYGSSEPNITFLNLKYLDISKNLDNSLLIE